MNIPSRKLTAALLLYFGAGAFSAAMAQAAAAPAPTTTPSAPRTSASAAPVTPTANTPADEPIRLDQMVVTGSLIPIAAGSTAVPVTVLGIPEMERTGVSTDLIDVLRKTQPAFYGSNNLGSDVANINSGDTNGGSGVSLRNRSTLVLVNGRRAVLSPVLASGGKPFVDVSTIPLSAIDRVEILSDGASATYGSDAVSGVVNIIMKTNYTGAEVGGSYGFSSNKEHWANRSYFAVAGASAGNTSVTVTTEWKKSDPLIQREREFSTGLYRTPSFAGSVSIGNDFYYLNPSLNAPAKNLDLTPAQLNAQNIYQGPLTQDEIAKNLDLATYPTLLQAAERRTFTAAIEHELNPSTRLFADFIYSLDLKYISPHLILLGSLLPLSKY